MAKGNRMLWGARAFPGSQLLNEGEGHGERLALGYVGNRRNRGHAGGHAGGAGNDPTCSERAGAAGCQTGQCEPLPPICGANVLGFNSLVQNPLGILNTDGIVQLSITSGDACSFMGRAMFLTSFLASQTPQLIATPVTQLPIFWVNARIGTIPQIRLIDAVQFGIPDAAFSDRKELTPIDWSPWVSTQNQTLSLSFRVQTALPQHAIGCVFGDVLGRNGANQFYIFKKYQSVVEPQPHGIG